MSGGKSFVVINLVFGEIFVFIIIGVGCFGVGGDGFGVGEFVVVGDDGIFCGFVGLSGEVFELMDDGFVVEDFFKNDMFFIEMWCLYSSNEELGIVCICGYVNIS